MIIIIMMMMMMMMMMMIIMIIIIIVTSPLQGSRLLWLNDPRPKQSPRPPPRSPVQKENKKPVPRNNNSSVPRNNNNNSLVPRNNPVIDSSDALAHARPLTTSRAQPGITPASLIPLFPIKALVFATQCPGILCKETQKI